MNCCGEGIKVFVLDVYLKVNFVRGMLLIVFCLMVQVMVFG